MKAERIERVKLTMSFGAAETEKSEEICYEGELRHLHVRPANFTNNVTTTISIEDADDYSYYTGSAINRNTPTNSTPNVFLAGKNTVKATLSGVPGGTGGDVIVVAHIKKTGN